MLDLGSHNLPKGVSPVISQKKVVQDNLKYIKDRKDGNYTLIKTFSDRLDKVLGYIEPNTTITISARSGGGKSTLSKRLINSIIENYTLQGKAIQGLSFNFEMLAHKTIGRHLSNITNLDLKTLYSTETPMSDGLYYKVKNEADKLVNLPMIYVEEPATYKDIGKTIMYYWRTLAKDKLFVVEIDHAMITKGMEGDSQRERIDGLMEELNMCKKMISAQGGNAVFIVLSQMNREIIKPERIINPSLQYPNTSDLFASSSIEFFSDYIIIAHSPARLNLSSYTDQKLPVHLQEPTGALTDFIYFHILKNRDGTPDGVIPFLSRLHRFDFEDVSLQDFITYHNQFKTTGTCVRKTLLNGLS